MADLVYFQHREGGAVHGFTLPLLPDLEEQIRKGVMVPVDAPPKPRTLDLPPGMVEEALKEEKRLSRKKKREELLKELAELGDAADDEDEDGEESEAKPAAPAKASAKPAVDDVDEPFGPIEPPSPELPRADGLSGGGHKTSRARSR